MTNRLLGWIDGHARPLLWTVAIVAVALRGLLVAGSPHEFGYVWDFYHEGITLLYTNGRLPASTDCAQCYQPPLFFLLGLPFYAFGRLLHPTSGWPHDAALWPVGVIPLASGFASLDYTHRLLRLVGQRGAWLVLGTALAAAFPSLFISSFGLEADILLAALGSAFTYYLTRWFIRPANRRWPATVRLGVLAGLAASTKFSGLEAVVAGALVCAAAWLHDRRGRAAVARRAAVFVALAVLVGGWKYADNTRRYGTPFFANGSASDGFGLSARSLGSPYEFTTFRLPELLALTGPGAPDGMLTTLPVYRSVWTTLHGLAWGDMGFFTNPTRHGSGLPLYPDRDIAPWLASSVLVLGVVPDILAVVGFVVAIRRRAYLPVLFVGVVGGVAYVAWLLPQPWWAIKAKYLLFLFPCYVLYTVVGLRWARRVLPDAVSAAIVVSMAALVVLANLYLLSFAVG